MKIEEALSALERYYRCQKNEDANFCQEFPTGNGSFCNGCPYDTRREELIEAMKAILEAHGRLKGGGEA